ncbi:DUF4391 domain-containing protein [Phascolarctobacterium sp.]
MLGLPRSTEFNKRIPKQKFYEHLAGTAALKRFFAEQIKTVYWRNKIAVTTMNIAAGTAVTEIEVFEIRLNQPQIDENVLRQIDKVIPYPILFLLEYEGKYKVAIGYKEAAAAGSKAFAIMRYYYTDWLPLDEMPVKLEGLNIDVIYENFVRQVATDQLQINDKDSIKHAIEKEEKRRRLKKQMSALQNKIRKEKQLNRQIKLNEELKKILKMLEESC